VSVREPDVIDKAFQSVNGKANLTGEEWTALALLARAVCLFSAAAQRGVDPEKILAVFARPDCPPELVHTHAVFADAAIGTDWSRSAEDAVHAAAQITQKDHPLIWEKARGWVRRRPSARDVAHAFGQWARTATKDKDAAEFGRVALSVWRQEANDRRKVG